MERMGALDASFLAIEDDVCHMHIGSVSVFEGPPPGYVELRELISSKLALVPRYRQRPREAPASIGRPLWVDDPHFNLDYHLRRTALPEPGGDTELQALVSRVMSQQLDRHKPLWEDWLVEGLPGNRWGLITKVHHCMVDGIAGSDLLSVILDLDPDAPILEPEPWEPASEPSRARLAWHSLGGVATAPAGWARGLARTLGDPRGTAGRLRDVGAGLLHFGGVLARPTHSSLVGPIGPHRRWTSTRATLDDVKAVRRALGGTVNDVVLAVVTHGLRELLLGRDDPVPADRTVRTLVPVSMRTPDARGVFDNRVAAVFAELPVGITEPVERLNAIRDQMDALKASHEIEASEAVLGLADFTPPILSALWARGIVHWQDRIETVATNVPGPQVPLYLRGRRMLEAYPYVPIAGHVRVGVAIWSYCGGLHFGVTGDWEGAPDVDRLTAGIDAGMATLLDSARAAAAC